jgi:predicted DCC family thiol-disulfide oxidoreductase YuxK
VTTSEQDEADAIVVYDGECPFCSRYVAMVRLRDAVGKVRLLNARDDDPLVDDLKRSGFDLDQGMVLVIGDRRYHGADCVNMLAMLSTPSGAFNRLNAAVFRSRTASRLLYPVLRAGRNLVIRLLGRAKIGMAA